MATHGTRGNPRPVATVTSGDTPEEVMALAEEIDAVEDVGDMTHYIVRLPNSPHEVRLTEPELRNAMFHLR